MNKSFNIKLLASAIIMMLSFSFASGQASKAVTRSSCRLYADKDNMSSVIKYLPQGAELELLSLEDDYFKVSVDSLTGFVLTSKVYPLNDEGEIVMEESVAVNETQEEVTVFTPQERYAYLESVYGQKTGLALFEHKIWKGISRQMAQDSWGEPAKINRSVRNVIIQEQWIFSRSWLFFENDKLIRWGPVR